MADMPMISIIVPVYKVEAWLDACVETVVNQTWKNLEIILVDDGSPDRCGALCDAWAQRDARVQVIHKKNGGLSSARNAGLDAAIGEHIMFLDSDDILHPEICTRLYTCMMEHKAQIAICDVAHVFSEKTPKYTITDECRSFSAQQAVREMWYQKSFLPSACAKLYQRDVFRELRFTEGLLYEDIDLMHQLFWEAETIVYNPSGLYGYCHRDDSITTKAFSVRDLDILKVAQKLLAFARENPSVMDAAKAYAVVAALRVELNAPNTPELAQGHAQARTLLAEYGRQVLKNPDIRKKTRYGLLLYFYCRPLMTVIYKRINRWK